MDKNRLSFNLTSLNNIPLNIALDIHSNELVALLGPSGSGKTTLLRCLAGLHKPVKGWIYSGDECWFDSDQAVFVKPEQRSLGKVYQSYALFPHLTAIENIMLPLHKLTRQQAKSSATEWLDKVNLSGLQYRKPHELSGGQRQRVALARALIAHPKLLLLDEPFSAVDQTTRFKLRRELALLRQQIQVPIILVTHDIEEAVQLADRICVLHHGNVLQIDKPDILMSRPKTPLVAKLLGQQNVFTGRISRKEKNHIILDWQGKKISVFSDEAYSTGDEVQWVLPPQGILLHRPDRADDGNGENPIHGIIEELVALGPHVSISVLPAHAPTLPLRFFIPRHFADRQHLEVGMSVSLSLLEKHIHLFESSC